MIVPVCPRCHAPMLRIEAYRGLLLLGWLCSIVECRMSIGDVRALH